MEKFTSMIEKTLVPIANKLSNNKYLKAISSGCMSLLGIIMVGAIFSIFSNIAWEPYNNFMASYGLDKLVAFVPEVTTNLLAIYMAFAVGFRGATCFENEGYAMSSGLLSLVGFMLLTPLDTTTLEGISFYNVSYLGTQGIFIAILSGLLVSRLLALIVHKNITIKMPNGVPPMVSESFSSLIAGSIILIVFIAIKVLFTMTPYGTANDCVYTLLQTPLQSLTGSLPAFLGCLLIAQLLWFFGVHGSMTVLPILFPVWIGYIGENMAAVEAGKAMPHVLNIGMWDLANLGGSGATIGLVILMCFFAKSKQYKQFGKLTFPCGIFSVNEPVIFGLPMILNTIMLIPFILCPIILVVLGYVLIQMGILTAPIGILGLGSMPPFISGLMQGSISWGIFQLVAVVISVFIYLPFFKIIDKQALEQEKGEENE